MSKFLLRHGHVFDERTPTGRRKGNWTRAFWRWADVISFDEPDDAAAYEHYRDCVRRCQEARDELARKVAESAGRPEWKPIVDALRCVKGIDVATAFLLACEAGDFSRFPTAPSFASWCGLTPSEHSSGESASRGGIARGQRPRALGARRGVLARAHVLARAEAARAGAGGVLGGEAPCDEMQTEGSGPQGGDGGLGQEAGCRELRHRARDGVLGVGDSEDGRGVAAPAKKGPTPGPAAFEAVGRPLGLFFMGRGTPRRPSTDSVTTEAPAVATKCAADEATRGY